MSKLDNIKKVIADKEEILNLRKGAIKNSDSINTFKSKSGSVSKEENKVDQDTGSIKKTVVGNCYFVMDSHEDVHVPGCFSKSIKERKDKIFHLHDHEYKITSKVGKPQDIYEKEISWKDLGVQKAGMTTALMMDTEIRKDYNERIYQAYKNGEIDQHSVGMEYVKIELAVDPEYAEEEKQGELWDKVYPKLANKEAADETGYFFVVKEAKLREISGVLIGSNTITPTLENKSTEPSEDTQKKEPSSDTLDENKLLKSLLNATKTI